MHMPAVPHVRRAESPMYVQMSDLPSAKEKLSMPMPYLP